MDNSLIEGFTENNNYYNLDNDNFPDNDINYKINDSMLNSTCESRVNIQDLDNSENHSLNNIENNNLKCNAEEASTVHFEQNLKCNHLNNIEENSEETSSDNKKNNNTKLENKDILKILESDDFYDPKKKININNEDINKIIHNLILIENDFIQDIKNKNIINTNDYPNIDDILSLYINRYNNIINSFGDTSKYLIYILNIIYLILIIYIFIGWASPYNLLLYHIIISILFLILFENKHNSSPFSIILKFLFNKDVNLLPFNYTLFKNIILLLVIISFIGLLNKDYTFFLFLKKIITNLSIYN